MSPTRRVIILVVAVTALATVAALLPLPDFSGYQARFGPLAPVAVTGIGAVLLVALVPRTPISLACGVLFGAGLGAVCALAAAATAAAATFLIGRWLGRDFVAARIARAGRWAKRWANIEGWIAREGVLAVAAVRALPLGPYGLVGYAYGGSNVRVRDYALGTLIAGTPSAISYAIVGAAVARRDSLDPVALIPLAMSLTLSAIVVARSRRYAVNARRQRDRVEHDVDKFDRPGEKG